MSEYDKNHPFWGTQYRCELCGKCLCETCHPHGACIRVPTQPREHARIQEILEAEKKR